jgi:hypothetical protein
VLVGHELDEGLYREGLLFEADSAQEHCKFATNVHRGMVQVAYRREHERVLSDGIEGSKNVNDFKRIC